MACLGRCGAGRLQDFYLFVNEQDLGHLFFELGIAAREIGADLVWLDRLGAEILHTLP
jgi:hypothetical protein